jgi:putative ABC transport system permease protein
MPRLRSSDTGCGSGASMAVCPPLAAQQNTPTARITLVARTQGDPLAIAGAVRAAIWSIDPNQPVDRVGRLRDLLAASASDQRFRTVLLATFAAAGLLLALVGVYGVTAAAVASRTWETGVRLALGARPANLVVGMLVETGTSVVIGAAAGVLAFLEFGRLLGGLLHQTNVADVRVIGAATSLIAIAAIAVAWIRRRSSPRCTPWPTA